MRHMVLKCMWQQPIFMIHSTASPDGLQMPSLWISETDNLYLWKCLRFMYKMYACTRNWCQRNLREKNKSQLDLTGVSYVHTCLYLSNIIQREDVPSPLIKSSYICSAASKNNNRANIYLKIVPFEHKYYGITSQNQITWQVHLRTAELNHVVCVDSPISCVSNSI